MDTLKQQKEDWKDSTKATQKINQRIAKLEKKRDKLTNETDIDDVENYKQTINKQRIINAITTYIG